MPHLGVDADVVRFQCCTVLYWLLLYDLTYPCIIAIGPGRTGMMIACYLLFAKICSTAQEAIHFFSERRTRDSKGMRCCRRYHSPVNY